MRPPRGLPGCWALEIDLRDGAGRVGGSTTKKQVADLVSALEANLNLKVKMRIFCRGAHGVVFDRLENRRVSKIIRSLSDCRLSELIQNSPPWHGRTDNLQFCGATPGFWLRRINPLWTLDCRFHWEAAWECVFEQRVWPSQRLDGYKEWLIWEYSGYQYHCGGTSLKRNYCSAKTIMIFVQ